MVRKLYGHFITPRLKPDCDPLEEGRELFCRENLLEEDTNYLMFQLITLYGNGLIPDLKSIMICPKVAN